jgi:hypothetical protein
MELRKAYIQQQRPNCEEPMIITENPIEVKGLRFIVGPGPAYPGSAATFV